MEHKEPVKSLFSPGKGYLKTRSTCFILKEDDGNGLVDLTNAFAALRVTPKEVIAQENAEEIKKTLQCIMEKPLMLVGESPTRSLTFALALQRGSFDGILSTTEKALECPSQEELSRHIEEVKRKKHSQSALPPIFLLVLRN